MSSWFCCRCLHYCIPSTIMANSIVLIYTTICLIVHDSKFLLKIIKGRIKLHNDRDGKRTGWFWGRKRNSRTNSQYQDHYWEVSRPKNTLISCTTKDIFRWAGHAPKNILHFGQKADNYKGRSGESSNEESGCSSQNGYHHNLSVKPASWSRNLHGNIYMLSDIIIFYVSFVIFIIALLRAMFCMLFAK